MGAAPPEAPNLILDAGPEETAPPAQPMTLLDAPKIETDTGEGSFNWGPFLLLTVAFVGAIVAVAYL